MLQINFKIDVKGITGGGSGAIAAVGSCEDIARNAQHAVEQLAKSGLLNPIEDVSGRQTLSLDDITRAVGSGCVPEVSGRESERMIAN